MTKLPTGANRGTISEGIITSAIATVFKNKDKNNKIIPITVKDIKKTLSQIKRDDVHVFVFDRNHLHVSVSMPTPSLDVLMNRDYYNELDVEFDTAVKFANTFISKAQEIVNDKRKRNDIFIKSIGKEEQQVSKSDIYININDNWEKNYSLKIAGGEQFSQIIGVGFDKQQELWHSFSGIDINKSKEKYEKLIKCFEKKYLLPYPSDEKKEEKYVKNLRSAMNLVYEEATNQLQDKNLCKKEITEFIINGITLGNKSVEMLKLSKGNFSVLKFDKKFEKKIMNLDLKVKLVKRKGLPLVEIYDIKEGVLFRIRGKFERVSNADKSGYTLKIRNLIEAGKLLDSLAEK
jgi:hypothetical protein